MVGYHQRSTLVMRGLTRDVTHLKAHWLSKEPADHEIVLTYNAPFCQPLHTNHDEGNPYLLSAADAGNVANCVCNILGIHLDITQVLTWVVQVDGVRGLVRRKQLSIVRSEVLTADGTSAGDEDDRRNLAVGERWRYLYRLAFTSSTGSTSDCLL